MRKICDKKEKIHKEGEKSPLEPGGASGAGRRNPRRVGRVGGEGDAPQRRGLPNGVPGGSADPVGEGGRAGAGRDAQWGPRRVADPVGKGGCAGAGRAARSGAEGQHESSGGRARRNGGSARLGRGAAAMGAKMPLLTSQAGHGDHCGKESSRRKIFLRNNREETRQATSAMGKASQTSSSTPVSEKRYATGMRMMS